MTAGRLDKTSENRVQHSASSQNAAVLGETLFPLRGKQERAKLDLLKAERRVCAGVLLLEARPISVDTIDPCWWRFLDYTLVPIH